MLRAANVKATIHELEILHKPEDEIGRMVRQLAIQELKKLANELWEEGMSATKGVNRSKTLFEGK